MEIDANGDDQHAADVLRRLEALDAELTALQAPVVARLRALLPEVIGTSFGSQHANDAFAERLEELLTRLKLRIRCPKDGCRATLRCRPTKHSRHGSFSFRHYWNGRSVVHGGKTTIPPIELVEGENLDDGGVAPSEP
ncbi:MAG TPA: hypothetical protein VMV10_16370 [Pirellulales bacterium]|nr:hypothetical protein [Pirellulales bacterium]